MTDEIIALVIVREKIVQHSPFYSMTITNLIVRSLALSEYRGDDVRR